MSRWNFSVEQDGMVVASGEAPTEAEAKREAGHYAMMYAQDGPVKVSVKRFGGTLPCRVRVKRRSRSCRSVLVSCRRELVRLFLMGASADRGG